MSPEKYIPGTSALFHIYKNKDEVNVFSALLKSMAIRMK